MPVQIRKTLLQMETTLIEGGKAAPRPLKLFSAVAVVKKSVGWTRLRRGSEAGDPQSGTGTGRASNQDDHRCRWLRRGG